VKNIGLFFGSFNPIHLGHLAVAEFFAQNTNLEEVWLVVSPQSPLKEKNTLMENHHRLSMVQLAIEDKLNLKACTEEFDLPSPNYTINTLNHLKKKYPQYQFTLLLGQDNIVHFDRWKAYRKILEQFQLYVYPRTQSDKIRASLLNHSNIVYFEASLLNVSATEIRNALKNKKLLADLLPQKIQDYLRKFNLYQ
tara:strand:- start:391 stop:972 length:582 start_codon:yes stop_codon:yes gene_type:complete